MTVWFARETVIRHAAAITVNTTQALDTQIATTAFETNVKNLTIVEPEGAIDKIDLLGETSGFQNAELDFKPFGLATISGTLILRGDEVLEATASGSGYDWGTHTRHQAGDSTAGKTRVASAFLVNLDDSTDEVNLLLNNAWVTKMGDKRISGADGHWEQDFNAVCLPKDYYVEYKD